MVRQSVRKMRVGDNHISYSLRAGSQRCILFLHGLGCSKDSFAGAFADGVFPGMHTLLAPDLVGHGESSKPKDFSYALEEQACLLVHLLDRLRIGRVNIVAHSMGGVVGLLLTEKIRELGSFFCLEGNLVPADCSVSLRVSSLEEEEFVQRIFPMASAQFRCKGSDTTATPEAYYRSARSLVHWSFQGRLVERYLGLPRKTYIYGEANKEVPVLEELSDSDVAQVAGSGHFMMIDNPEDTYGEIVKRL